MAFQSRQNPYEPIGPREPVQGNVHYERVRISLASSESSSDYNDTLVPINQHATISVVTADINVTQNVDNENIDT